MRRMVYLIFGFLVAGLLGLVYIKLTGTADVPAVVAPPPPSASDGADKALLVAAIVFSWVTAFVRMPHWLAVLLGTAIVWIGFSVMCVSGFFVYMQYPNNTLADGAYVAFLGSIAIVVSRAGSVLKYMQREGAG